MNFLTIRVYLLGFLHMKGVTAGESLGVGRLLSGVGFLIFAFSLLPAMFGSSLGELEAYVPSAQTTLVARGSGSGDGNSGTTLPWLKDQLSEALAKARDERKPVLVNFTGYACTNCHWMKANMFTRPEIVSAMKDFVLVDLYTDGSDDASEKNQKMQSSRFQTVALPFYAILDADGNTMSTFSGLTRDPNEWLAFLAKGTRLRS
jgi:thiol:disulfide interchange protein DsbD